MIKTHIEHSATTAYIKKLVLAGVLVALGVCCSMFYIPVGASKCFPIQHLVNVLASVILGPWYAVGMAFTTSLIRIMLGTGSLLAFPGSMIGALISGLIFKHTKKYWTALAGELVGTGIIGSLLAYPVAAFIMGKEAALFAYVIPFSLSSAGGVVLAAMLLTALLRVKPIKRKLVN